MSHFKRSLDNADLAAYVSKQLNNLFPDPNLIDDAYLLPYVQQAITRSFDCHRHILKKYYRDGDDTLFNHLNSDHYAMYLYLLSNTVHRAGGDESVASKLFLLNKALHGLDAFYSIQLPEVFLFVHPVGTVIGNGSFGNYFAIYQNCAVGATPDGGYPSFGRGILMYAKSSVLGGCKVGSNVVFGANAFVLSTDIPDDSTIVGSYPQNKIVDNHQPVIDRIFR
ncbi:MAG: serine acetyltransferase [Chthonomonadales bacterium]